MSNLPSGGDLTPISGSQTDIAPLGRQNSPPAHEQPAGRDPAINWQAIANDPKFQSLVRAKIGFIVPATIFFVVYYFLLPISVGWFPELMTKEVIGHVNLAYVFAFSQFVMAWALAAIYVKVAAGWDRRAAEVLAQLKLR